MTAQELADELEVSVRTVYRDIDSLSTAGIPVQGDAGHSGGFSLVDGYRTRLSGLRGGGDRNGDGDGPEVGALPLTGLPGPAAELSLGAVLAAAQVQLTAALPANLRTQTARIRERFHLDSPSWYREAESLPHLAALAGAVWDQRPIQVRYQRWGAGEEVHRALDPYGIVLKGGVWYLVAGNSAGDGSVRTYLVSQILALSVQDATFDRPAGFDLAEHWSTCLAEHWSIHMAEHWRIYTAEFDARRFHAEAAIRLAPDALRRLPDLFEPAVCQAVEASASPPDAAGWVRAVIPIESPAHALPLLLRLGGDVEVLSPTELRRAATSEAARMLALYTGGHQAVGMRLG